MISLETKEIMKAEAIVMKELVRKFSIRSPVMVCSPLDTSRLPSATRQRSRRDLSAYLFIVSTDVSAGEERDPNLPSNLQQKSRRDLQLHNIRECILKLFHPSCHWHPLADSHFADCKSPPNDAPRHTTEYTVTHTHENVQLPAAGMRGGRRERGERRQEDCTTPSPRSHDGRPSFLLLVCPWKCPL